MFVLRGADQTNLHIQKKRKEKQKERERKEIKNMPDHAVYHQQQKRGGGDRSEKSRSAPTLRRKS